MTWERALILAAYAVGMAFIAGAAAFLGRRRRNQGDEASAEWED